MRALLDQASGKTAAATVTRLGLAFLVLMIFLLPLVYAKGSLLSFLSQVAIVSVFTLSYNMLLGQTGLLSIGHAVFSGIGGYCAIHLMNRYSADGLGLGMLALPLFGGLGGAMAGVVFGYISTRRAGTTFAMITLGISEMMVALALLLPGLSGGEAGITTNRMLNKAIFGIDFGSDIQIYYFVWCWMLLSAALMYAFTRTPMGRLANAVRDNPERVAFIGFNPQKVRWMVTILAGLFAGIAGSLSMINYELMSIDTLGVAQSGMVLVATYLGGIGYFLGPVVGAFIYVLFLNVISTLTRAWLLYFGVLFVSVVMFTPEGLLGLFRKAPGIRNVPKISIVMALLMPFCFVFAVEAVYGYQDSDSSPANLYACLRDIVPLALLFIAYAVMPLIKRWRARRAKETPSAAAAAIEELAHD